MRSLAAATGWVVSWMVVGSIPLTEITTCTQGSTDAWLGSLVLYAPLAGLSLALLSVGRRGSGTTRWLSLPQVVLLPYAAFVVALYFERSTMLGEHLCVVATGQAGFSSYPRQWWNSWWAPAEAAILAAYCTMMWLYWRAPANKRLEPTGLSGALAREASRAGGSSARR